MRWTLRVPLSPVLTRIEDKNQWRVIHTDSPWLQYRIGVIRALAAPMRTHRLDSGNRERGCSGGITETCLLQAESPQSSPEMIGMSFDSVDFCHLSHPIVVLEMTLGWISREILIVTRFAERTPPSFPQCQAFLVLVSVAVVFPEPSLAPVTITAPFMPMDLCGSQ